MCMTYPAAAAHAPTYAPVSNNRAPNERHVAQNEARNITLCVWQIAHLKCGCKTCCHLANNYVPTSDIILNNCNGRPLFTLWTAPATELPVRAAIRASDFDGSGQEFPSEAAISNEGNFSQRAGLLRPSLPPRPATIQSVLIIISAHSAARRNHHFHSIRPTNVLLARSRGPSSALLSVLHSNK